MEMVMTNGFAELSLNEMEMIDGGGKQLPGWMNTLGAIFFIYELGYAAGKAVAHATSK